MSDRGAGAEAGARTQAAPHSPYQLPILTIPLLSQDGMFLAPPAAMRTDARSGLNHQLVLQYH